MIAEQQLDEALASWGLGGANRERLAGDVSHRRYYRLRGGGLSGTAVGMVTPPDEAHKMADWVAIGEYLQRHGVPVPLVLRRCDERLVLLITDVGDTLLTDATNADPWYHRVLAHLARIEAAAREEGPGTSPAHGRALEEIRIRWELRRFRKVVAAPIADLDDDELAAWKDGEDALVAALTGAPQAWMHRDLHARNLLVHHDRVWWIDFQDAMIGPWLYDVASLLFDPYAALSDDRRGALLEHYLALPGRVHATVPPAAVPELWATAAVQRLVHCVACYVWVREHHGNDLYVRYIPFALGHLRRQLAVCRAAAPLARVMESRWAGVEERWCRDAVPC